MTVQGDPEVEGTVVRPKVRYDGTITLGHILIMVGIAFSGIGLYTTTVVKLSSHEARITALERLAEGQSTYNKAALEILEVLKTSNAVRDAVTKDRESRPPLPDELKGRR